MKPDDELADLITQVAAANSALVRGDIEGYLAIIEHSDDYVLMAPFGGKPTHGFDSSAANRASLARFFRSGTLEQQVVSTYRSGDIVVLVTVEHVRAEVGGLAQQDWSLRVTQVFRRNANRWALVHRHAGPLANGVGLSRAAELARGE